MALSISLASDPNVSDPKDAAVKDLHARVEKFNINSRGGDGGAVHGVRGQGIVVKNDPPCCFCAILGRNR